MEADVRRARCGMVLVLGMMVAVSVAAQTPAAKPDLPGHGKAKAAKPADPPKRTPIPQMSPEQLPAQAPRVSYRDGQLSIDSQNATLSDVLTAVRRQTGMQMDLPPGSGSERVAVHLAGPACSVISSLLDGSNLGYIIVGVAGEPDKIARVILTTPQKPAGTPATAGSSPRTPSSAEADEGPEDVTAEPEPTEAAAPPPQPAPPNGSPQAGTQPPNPYTGGAQPRFGRPFQIPPNAQQAPPDPNQPQSRTPEQMLQELQMRQQQQQGQDQQQQ
jgi:hypothetical protein